MKTEEITALAREYAEESTKADESDPNLSELDLIEIRHDIEEYVTGILGFLLHRYCLVEKSKAKEMYDVATEVSRLPKSVEARGYAISRLQTLESLFPEIAKEIEQ